MICGSSTIMSIISIKRLTDLSNIALALMPSLNEEREKAYHFSFILYRSKILTIGTNIGKTHPEAYKLKYAYPSIHSELSAYVKAKKLGIQLSDCALVNIRLSRLSIKKKRPILRMSKPCKYCLPWCQSTFDKIIYTTDEGFIEINE